MTAPPRSSEKAITLALSLAQAESALEAFAAGEIDAVVDADGKTYLLRPAQERLRDDESWLRSVFESTGDGVTVVNREGLIVSQNRTATRMLGFGADELLGLSFLDLVEAGELHQFQSAFFNVIEDFRADALVDFHLLARDGTYLKVEAIVSKLRDAATVSIVLTCRDATRRSPALEEAQRREATLVEEALVKDRRQAELIEEALAKDRFIAMLSHELRTPLSPISLGVDDLREDERFAEARPTLTMIRRNVDLQSRLLEELFDFTKVGQHKVRMRLEPVDAHEAVGFVLEICKAELAAADIKVLLNLSAGEGRVMADSVRLQQVMWNLVKNAVKFSTPGSTIFITSANNEAGELVLHFVDHGIGIDAALLPLIFNPFRQGNHDETHVSGGLGLGLFIAKGMIEAQDGTLTVASAGRGHGATFVLTLPTADLSQLSRL